MRKQIAAANWKMNLTWQQAQDLIKEMLAVENTLNENRLAIIAPAFPYLQELKTIIGENQNWYISAQNMADKKSGAFTGEVSGEMLKSIGLQYVIIGHSERREYYNETNAILATKTDLALEFGLQPIFCCGEPLSIREASTQNDYVQTQLEESLFHLSPSQMKNFVIAYEPIWAIGTGLTATSEQAQEMHAHIRKVLQNKYGEDISNSISILYGGSVKAANAKEIFGQPDVDGGLVGGASLIAKEFVTIINSLK